jgi:hypothetical protein
VIAQLSKIRSLKVIGRGSVMRFKGREQSLREIGIVLDVTTLLEGSVRRAGSRVRIVAQLIDAETDRPRWSETYDRDLTDIFAIQTDVAVHIADALEAELTHEERNRLNKEPTDDLQAYQLYLQAKHCLTRWTQEGTDRRSRTSARRSSGIPASRPPTRPSPGFIWILASVSGAAPSGRSSGRRRRRRGHRGSTRSSPAKRARSWATEVRLRLTGPVARRELQRGSIELNPNSGGPTTSGCSVLGRATTRRSRCRRARAVDRWRTGWTSTTYLRAGR